MGVDAHGLEHGRGFERLRRARAPGVRGDAGLIETEQHRLRLDAVDADAHVVGKATIRTRLAQHLDALDGVEAGDQPIAVGERADLLASESGDAGVIARHQGCRGRAQAHDARHVLEARPPRPFLIPAEQEGLEAQAPPDEERTRAGRCTELVAADREQVDPQLGSVDRHSPHSLGGVDVHEDPPLATCGDHLVDGLQGRDLVVPPLEMDQGGVRGRARHELCGVDAAQPVRADRGDRSARHPGVRLGRATYRRVLDGGQHDVGPVPGVDRPTHRPPGRRGDGLGGAAGEDHLAAAGTDERSELGSSPFDRDPCPHALGVDPPGVGAAQPETVVAVEPLDDGVPRLGAQGCGRRVVEVVAVHRVSLRTLPWRRGRRSGDRRRRSAQAYAPPRR